MDELQVSVVPHRSSVGVWMDGDSSKSISRVIAIDCMLALGLDPDDWRTRDKIIMGICRGVDEVLDQASGRKLTKLERACNSENLAYR